MKDYLSDLCTNLNIELVYTDDDYTALSVSTKGKKVALNADKVFMGCPEKVAKAVIGYYTEYENEDSNLKIINNYIHDNIVTVDYTVNPPDEKLQGMRTKHNGSGASAEDKQSEDKLQKSKESGVRTSGSKTAKGRTTKASKSKDSTSSLVELEIVSMTKKSFNGRTSNVSPNEGIKVSSDDVVELDIEIDSPRI